jgi:hypothetical protein
MTDKEIYKARAEGFRLISEFRESYKSGNFYELLDFTFRISKENSPDYFKHREEKIKEKIKFRKNLNKLFKNDKL